MAKVLQVNGSFEGPPGKSAYEYAQDGGYTGTEEEFAEKLATNLQLDATLRDDTKAAPAGMVGKLKSDLVGKLDKPSTAPSVGKILKVTAVNEDGSFVCEWADGGGGDVTDVQINGTSIVSEGVAIIPTLKTSTYGLVKVSPYRGMKTFSDGMIAPLNPKREYIDRRNESAISDVSSTFAVTLSELDYAVKAAMCDGKAAAWTAEEQAAARERIAADGAWQCVTLTADDYDAENHRFLIDAGEGRQISEVYGIGQVVTDTPADAALTVGIGFGNANNISYGSFGQYSIQATNTQTSFSFDGKSIDFTSVKSDTFSQFGTVKYSISKYAISIFYVDANIGITANSKSMIYWRYNNPRYFSIFGLWDNVTWAAIKIYIKLR